MDISVRHNFTQTLESHDLPYLHRTQLSDLQINLGYLCNQACEHCHVEAGPKRTELMDWETMEKVLNWAERAGIRSVDLTGGAPEMNPHFRELILAFQDQGAEIISRCNLTILMEPGFEGMAKWYADHKIRLVSSLPCYTRKNVEQQRGKGVFGKSVDALLRLNDYGYAQDPDLPMDLVYNPGGAFLPPAQATLEQDYKTHLKEDFGIEFSRLLTITNLPIKRFEHYLKRTGQLESYLSLLVENFNPCTVSSLMCRQLISIDWQGNVFDCDFNQMLEMPLGGVTREKLWNLDVGELDGSPIAVGTHCYGCTAGAGSSCGGALD
jgi:radical SAM/Cys-rich protein